MNIIEEIAKIIYKGNTDFDREGGFTPEWDDAIEIATQINPLFQEKYRDIVEANILAYRAHLKQETENMIEITPSLAEDLVGELAEDSHKGDVDECLVCQFVVKIKPIAEREKQMNRTEEIKKILLPHLVGLSMEIDEIHKLNDTLATQINQLFQAPDEVRLSDEEWRKAWWEGRCNGGGNVGSNQAILKAQTNKAKLYYEKQNQDMIREIFNKIEEYKVDIDCDCQTTIQGDILIFEEDWQFLKTKYLKEGG